MTGMRAMKRTPMSYPKPLILMIKYDSFRFKLFVAFKDSIMVSRFLFFLRLTKIEFIRRRQHISTIDTNSPSRLLLASNMSSNSSFLPNSSIQVHKNHNAIGYCTLRNGSLHGPSHMNSSNIMSMSPVPKAFQNPVNTCTLPRHHNNQQPLNNWPSYGGTIAGVRNVSQTITISGSQPPPPSTIAMHNLGPAPRPRICVGGGLPEDDAEMPLMMKRESTVWL